MAVMRNKKKGYGNQERMTIPGRCFFVLACTLLAVGIADSAWAGFAPAAGSWGIGIYNWIVSDLLNGFLGWAAITAIFVVALMLFGGVLFPMNKYAAFFTFALGVGFTIERTTPGAFAALIPILN